MSIKIKSLYLSHILASDLVIFDSLNFIWARNFSSTIWFSLDFRFVFLFTALLPQEHFDDSASFTSLAGVSLFNNDVYAPQLFIFLLF